MSDMHVAGFGLHSKGFEFRLIVVRFTASCGHPTAYGSVLATAFALLRKALRLVGPKGPPSVHLLVSLPACGSLAATPLCPLGTRFPPAPPFLRARSIFYRPPLCFAQSRVRHSFLLRKNFGA